MSLSPSTDWTNKTPFYRDDRGKITLRNACINLQNFMASHLRRRHLLLSWLSECQTSQFEESTLLTSKSLTGQVSEEVTFSRPKTGNTLSITGSGKRLSFRLQSVQTSSTTHLASSSRDTIGSFPVAKAAAT